MAKARTITTKAAPAETASTRRRTIGRPSSANDSVGRETLIDVTCRLLKELPPDKVTRVAVARGSGVDPSLIRYYFRTRESLLVAAAKRVTEEFGAVLNQRLAQTPATPIDRLRARIASLLEMHVTYPFFHRLIIEHVLNSDAPEAKEMFNDLTTRALGGYADIVAAGVDEGSLRKIEPVFLFVAVVGMCEYFISAEPILKFAFGRRYGRRKAHQEYVAFVTEMVLNGLRAEVATSNP